MKNEGSFKEKTKIGEEKKKRMKKKELKKMKNEIRKIWQEKKIKGKCVYINNECKKVNLIKKEKKEMRIHKFPLI